MRDLSLVLIVIVALICFVGWRSGRALRDRRLEDEICRANRYGKHILKNNAVWSQDGWVTKCAACDKLVYLGDGPDPEVPHG